MIIIVIVRTMKYNGGHPSQGNNTNNKTAVLQKTRIERMQLQKYKIEKKQDEKIGYKFLYKGKIRIELSRIQIFKIDKI